MTTASADVRDWVVRLRDMPVPRRRPLLLDAIGNTSLRDLQELQVASQDELGSPWGLWQDDPVGYVCDVLGESITTRQATILRDVEATPKVAVPSCFSSGKSHIAGRLVPWWISVWPLGTARCITTASRMRQVDTHIWPHVASIVDRNGLPGRVGVHQWVIPRSPEDRNSGEKVAYGFTPPQYDPEAVQGEHAPHQLVIIDEAGLIPVPTGRAWDSATTGSHTRLVAFGNPPTDEEDSWLEQISRSLAWKVRPIPADTTPNFTGEDPGRCRYRCPDWRVRPHSVAEHLISRANVETFIGEHGRDSPFVISKVYARFPRGGAPKTIPAAWVERARFKRAFAGVADVDLDIARGPRPRVDLGVDVAESGGDELVIARGEGRLLRITHTSRLQANANANTVAGYVLRQIEEAEQLAVELGADLDRHPVRVKVDAIGVGWGIVGILQAWRTEGRHRALIVAVKASEAAEDRGRYLNRRAEQWETLRELLQPAADGGGVVTLDIDERTVHQLSTPKRENHSDGRIKVESVADMKERGEDSPDRATALTLVVYNPPGLMPSKPLRGLMV